MKQNAKKQKKRLTAASIAAILTVLLSLTMIVMPAAEDRVGGYLGDIPKTDVAITIDAVKDKVYSYGLTVDVNYEKDAPVRAKGKVTLLYSGGWLYAFAEVTDRDMIEPDPELQQKSPWRTDSFEVFVNKSNSDSVNDVMQYRIDSTGYPTVYTKTGLAAYGPDKAKEYFRYAAARNDNGYCAEFAIPIEFTGGSADGKYVGVNFQINDIYGTDYTLTWAVLYCEATQMGLDSWNVPMYPSVSLGAKTTVNESGVVSGPTEVPATDAPATDNPATDVPATDNPATDNPATDAPVDKTDEPAKATDVPADKTDEPAPTDKPADNTQSPAAKDSSGLPVGAIIGICAAVAAIIVVIVMIIIKKNKK